jgi:hypothetical protein
MKLHASYKALSLESVASASLIAANRADATFPSLLQRLGHAVPAEAEAKQLADVLLKHEPLKQRVRCTKPFLFLHGMFYHKPAVAGGQVR